MDDRSERSRTDGGVARDESPPPAGPAAGQDSPRNPTCNCLPSAPDGWLACAHCGLPQAPGKAFCGFCGNRWQGDDPG